MRGDVDGRRGLVPSIQIWIGEGENERVGEGVVVVGQSGEIVGIVGLGSEATRLCPRCAAAREGVGRVGGVSGQRG